MKKEYETPRFESEELVLSESVADTCWGTNAFWFEFNGKEGYQTEEHFTMKEVKLDSSGCNGSNWADGFKDYIATSERFKDYTEDQKKAIQAKISSNVCNTKAEGFTPANS